MSFKHWRMVASSSSAGSLSDRIFLSIRALYACNGVASTDLRDYRKPGSIKGSGLVSRCCAVLLMGNPAPGANGAGLFFARLGGSLGSATEDIGAALPG